MSVEERQADLVVVGYGAAGAAAALRAAELGASVLIVEKQPEDAHTPSTRMSGGHIMLVNDADKATAYLDHCSGGMIPLPVTRAWAERALTLGAWLDGHGTDLRLQQAYGAEHPEIAGAESIEAHMQARLKDGTGVDFQFGDSSSAEAQGVVWSHRNPQIRTGPELWTSLAAAVARRPEIELIWDAPAQQLLQDESGRVVGVAAGHDGSLHVRGRGVVLASGGYEYDDELKLNYLKAFPTYFYGNPGNTGDGLRMAQSVGADLWHMNQMIGRGIAHFDLDGSELNLNITLPPGGYVLVDRDGRRFANELAQALGRHDFYFHLLLFDPERGIYPRIPCYWIFDAERLTRPIPNQLIGPTAVGIYDWSADNSAEIERGWIHVADTIEELAEQIGVDADVLTATVRAYNEACRTGDDAVGRPASSLVPIETAPFGCVPLYPGGSNSSGGPRRNERAEIVDPFGRPIPGLYGAGELGQAIGMLYPAGGCNISEALCFGQIAAESALT